jgi:hypothetical protein
MKGRLITLLLFGTFVVWLVGSYLPPNLLFGQMIPGEGLIPFFRVALIISALLFVVIQIVLIAAVFKFPQRIRHQDNRVLTGDTQETEGAREVTVEHRWEVLWTAVPLVVSVGLFIVSYWVLIS